MEHPPKLTKKLEDVTKEDLTAELFWLNWARKSNANLVQGYKNPEKLKHQEERIAHIKTLLLLKGN